MKWTRDSVQVIYHSFMITPSWQSGLLSRPAELRLPYRHHRPLARPQRFSSWEVREVEPLMPLSSVIVADKMLFTVWVQIHAQWKESIMLVRTTVSWITTTDANIAQCEENPLSPSSSISSLSPLSSSSITTFQKLQKKYKAASAVELQVDTDN